MGMDIRQITVEGLTQLNYAFGYITPGDFYIVPMPGVDPLTFGQFASLKQNNPALIVEISLGGWVFNGNGTQTTQTQDAFGDIISRPENRQKFITNLLAFMYFYGFDAVDLDWEYPGAPDRQHNRDSSLDAGAYAVLLQDLRNAFDQEPSKLYLSFTAPTSYWHLRWFDIGLMAETADYFNLTTYDLHGTWDADDFIGAQVLAHTNLTEIGLALDLLSRNDVSPSKVNLGLAF